VGCLLLLLSASDSLESRWGETFRTGDQWKTDLPIRSAPAPGIVANGEDQRSRTHAIA
jgi:hypothetical protein